MTTTTMMMMMTERIVMMMKCRMLTSDSVSVVNAEDSDCYDHKDGKYRQTNHQ